MDWTSTPSAFTAGLVSSWIKNPSLDLVSSQTTGVQALASTTMANRAASFDRDVHTIQDLKTAGSARLPKMYRGVFALNETHMDFH